ncbi:MAG TPA: AI-2E family transporter [Acidimicrobiales bacterium]|nr:AI-2E family transporter [Acidimicrobiales bacterium]
MPPASSGTPRVDDPTAETESAALADQEEPPVGDGLEQLETRRARLWEWADARRIPLQAIIAVVVVAAVAYLGGKLVYKLREIMLLMLVAGFIALLLNPAVIFIQRRVVHRRGGAVAIVTALALLVFAGLAFAFGYPLVNGITHLAENLPKYVSQAEHGKGWIGHLVRKYHVQHWVQQNLAPKLTTFAKNLSKPALTLGKGAVTLVIALFTIFILVLLLLLEGSKLRRGVLRLMNPGRRATVIRVAEEVSRSVTGYMFGNFITSVIAGLVVYVTLLIMGVPFPLLWALWVAILDFLPMVGGALAGIPTVLFALAHSLKAGIVVLIVFLVYTQIENHILNPIVMSRTVRVNPLLVLIAILVGASVGDLVGGFFGGFVGTLLAIPVAGSIQVIVRELWQGSETDPLESAGASTGTQQGGGKLGKDENPDTHQIADTDAAGGAAAKERADGASEDRSPPGEDDPRGVASGERSALA